jgi:starch synthase (maltosyl-transferring)
MNAQHSEATKIIRTPEGRETGGRVVITNVEPSVENGRFPAKAIVGDTVWVEADVFLDAQDEVAAVLQYRRLGEPEWSEAGMSPLRQDRFRAGFEAQDLGIYEYRIEAWPDAFQTWRRDLTRRFDAGQDVGLELVAGAVLVAQAAARAAGADQTRLEERAVALGKEWDAGLRAAIAVEATLAELMAKYSGPRHSTSLDQSLRVVVERPRARFGAWYEMFPRSASPDAGRSGTLKDVIGRLPYIAEMGFDVLYLPPIHPIGTTHRKGRNNTPVAKPGDPGSPWGIGATLGGHKTIDPELGTIDDFSRLQQEAAALGIEIAIDVAFQCSPDHPYVREHPEWFRRRPDGSIRYAENPPKKYEDIYPLDFQCEDWPGLWSELESIVAFWLDQGIRIFRVDNPHTKPFAFWEWLIRETRARHPDVVFLAEAFTRESVMFHLAKLGFSQSYTYFTWRNTKDELVSYFTALSQRGVQSFFRPSLWPNTPDILHAYLQTGGRPAFITRLILAATLAASYGIYGPAFELGEHSPIGPGSEEYLNSDKYEARHWEINRPDSLRDVIARVNRIRRENAPFHADANLVFHSVENDNLIAYSKTTGDGQAVLAVVNLNPAATESGWVDLSLDALGLAPDEPFQVHDLLRDERYVWQGARNFVMLDPRVMPAHLFRINGRQRDEHEFEYFA